MEARKKMNEERKKGHTQKKINQNEDTTTIPEIIFLDLNSPLQHIILPKLKDKL